jgi:hypothetical protein
MIIKKFLIQTDLYVIMRSLQDVNKKKAHRGDCRFACFNSATAEGILIKFNINLTPLEAIQSAYFCYKNKADVPTCEIRATL